MVLQQSRRVDIRLVGIVSYWQTLVVDGSGELSTLVLLLLSQIQSVELGVLVEKQYSCS